MLAIITKANDDFWYEFKEVDTIEDLLRIYPTLIIEPNFYTKNIAEFWDGFLEEDIEKLERTKIHITIYNDYVE